MRAILIKVLDAVKLENSDFLLALASRLKSLPAPMKRREPGGFLTGATHRKRCKEQSNEGIPRVPLENLELSEPMRIIPSCPWIGFCWLRRWLRE